MRDDVKVVFDEPFITILWDARHRWLYVRWRGWCTAEEIRPGIEAFLEAARQHHPEAFVSDCRERRVIHPEAQALLDDCIHRFSQLGGRRLAIVMPSRELTRLTLEAVVGRYAQCLEVRAFATPEEAAEWLTPGVPLTSNTGNGDSTGAATA